MVGSFIREHVTSVSRNANQVNINTAHGTISYDHVVMACHSDQALDILKDPSAEENNILWLC